MDSVKDVFRERLARSLASLSHADRLSAAWVVVCGKAMAERGEIIDFKEGVISVEVEGGAWLEHFRSIRNDLQTELSRIAGLPVTGIHFVVKR